MKQSKFILTSIYEYLNSNKVNYDKLNDLAKQHDYMTFLEKTDNLVFHYNILYRGFSEEDEITDKSFFTDYIGHALQYGEHADGIIYNNGDVLHISDDEFQDLRKSLRSLNKNEIENIYSYYFIHNKLFDAMGDDYPDEQSVVNFVSNFLKSDKPYSEVQKHKVKNDLLVPIMLHYAQLKNKNIISFTGGDYSDFGGADEFVVNDVSRYIKLSTIWKRANQLPD